MLAIERSERVSITTGLAVRTNVAGGDSLDGHGHWGRLWRRHGWITVPGVPATSLASLASLAGSPGYSDDTLRVFRPHQKNVLAGYILNDVYRTPIKNLHYLCGHNL